VSLILDALSRAERDKQAGAKAAPDLLSQPQHATVQPSRRRVLLGIALLALVAAVGVLVFLMLDRRGETPVSPPPAAPGAQRPRASVVTEPVSAAVPAAATVPAAGQTNSPVTAPVREALQATAAASASERRSAVPDPQVQALYDGAVPAAVPPDRSSARAAEPAVVTAPPRGTPATRAENPEDVAADFEQVLREARAQTRNLALEENPTPFLDELSGQFRDSVPTLMYLRHDFNSSGQSTVLINGETLREGQRTRGVELREILDDSIIMRFNGTEFRLRALNSWVNL